MRISDVIRETGLSRNTVTLRYKETAKKVDLEAVDKLCALFNCELVDLLERVADSGEALLVKIKAKREVMKPKPKAGETKV